MNRFTRGLKQLTQMVFGRTASGRSPLFLPRTAIDYEREVGDGTKSDIVMAGVHWLMGAFPEAPVILKRLTSDGSPEPVLMHDFLALLKRPNPYYSGEQLWMGIEMSYTVSGNAYAIIVSNNAGRPAQLWWVPHWMMEPEWDREGNEFLTHYVYSPPGQRPIRIEPEEVLHFRFGFDPNNPRKGLSPLRTVMRELFTDAEAANYTASLLRNGAVPSVIVMPKENANIIQSDDDLKATKADLSASFKGDRRGEPMAIGAPVDIEQFGYSPEQMDLASLRRIPETRAAAVLRLPPIVMGLLSGLEFATYANFREAERVAYRANLIPTYRNMAGTLHTQLLSRFEPNIDLFEVQFDTSQVEALQENADERAARWRGLYVDGLAELGEARAEVGLTVDPAVHAVRRVPLAALEVPAGEAASSFLPPPSGPETRSRKAVGIKATAAQRNVILALQRDALRLEEAFTSDLEPAFEELGRLAERAYQEAQVLVRAGGNGLEEKQTPADEALAERIIQRMALSQWSQDALIPAFDGHYLRTTQMTVGSINTVLNLGVNLPDPVAREIVAAGGRRAGLLDITGDTRRAIFRSLADGRAAGEGPPALARRIRSQVPAGRFSNAGPKYRAQLIARTETLHAQRVSSLETYRASDVVTGVVAFDNQTGFDDADCIARNGRVFTFEEAEAEMAAEHPSGTLNFAPNVG